MVVDISIPELGNKFQDYRKDILGESYNWGPVINPDAIVNFTLHHSVTAQTAKVDGNWKKECDVIASLHVNGNGWDGIGYRFVICSDGTVAYVGDLSHGGSAVANNNDRMFSACFVGDFTKQLPTAAQIHSAHLLAKWFLTQAPQYKNLNSWDQVKGHKEFGQTACPGTNWKGPDDSTYNRVRGDLWQGYPDPQPITTPVTPAPTPTPVPSNEVDQLRKQLSDANGLLTLANEKIRTLEGQNRSLQSENETLKNKLRKINADSTL